MRILFITPYIYNSFHKSFQKNHTGFGLMVADMANSIGKKLQIDVYPINIFTSKILLENYKILPNKIFYLFMNFKIKSIKNAFNFIKKYKLPWIEKIRVVYQFISIGSVESILKNYDLVHIHGCGPYTDAAIKICTNKRIPFLITLHGLISFEKAVNAHQSLKEFEKDLLLDSYINNYNVNFISTGNLDTVTNYIKTKI